MYDKKDKLQSAILFPHLSLLRSTFSAFEQKEIMSMGGQYSTFSSPMEFKERVMIGCELCNMSRINFVLISFSFIANYPLHRKRNNASLQELNMTYLD